MAPRATKKKMVISVPNDAGDSKEIDIEKKETKQDESKENNAEDDKIEELFSSKKLRTKLDKAAPMPKIDAKVTKITKVKVSKMTKVKAKGRIEEQSDVENKDAIIEKKKKTQVQDNNGTATKSYDAEKTASNGKPLRQRKKNSTTGKQSKEKTTKSASAVDVHDEPEDKESATKSTTKTRATRGRRKEAIKENDSKNADSETLDTEKIAMENKNAIHKNKRKVVEPNLNSTDILKTKKNKRQEKKDVGIDKEPLRKKSKVNKNKNIGKGDDQDVDTNEKDDTDKAKDKTSKEPEDGTGEPAAKKSRQKTADNGSAGNEKKAPLKNKTVTNYKEINFSNTSINVHGKEWNFKIASWNVDGIRAWVNKGGLDYIKYEKPDILCLQEIKCSKDKLPVEVNVPGYHTYWLSSDQDGYAGVGIFTTKMAINLQYGLHDKDLDNEGRIITAEYEQFYLISTYVPNAGRKLVSLPKRLQWNEKFRSHVKELDKNKPVIICGDMNVAHQEIDLTNPKTNKRNAGFTEEERAGMTELLGDGFVDTFRLFYPNRTGCYTFWTYMMNSRAKNVGWRLDYFIVSERILPMVCDSIIRSDVYGSDHCPIALLMHLTSADKPKKE